MAAEEDRKIRNLRALNSDPLAKYDVTTGSIAITDTTAVITGT